MIGLPIYSKNWYPIKYPKHPPIIDPTEHTNAYLNALAGLETANAIKRTSGGIGKKEDSQNASIKSAQVL